MSKFSYNKILIVGPTSGIGKGLAEKFLKEEKDVVITGRRKANLEEFVKPHGSSRKASYSVFDILKLDEIPSWVEKYARSLILNSYYKFRANTAYTDDL